MLHRTEQYSFRWRHEQLRESLGVYNQHRPTFDSHPHSVRLTPTIHTFPCPLTTLTYLPPNPTLDVEKAAPKTDEATPGVTAATDAVVDENKPLDTAAEAKEDIPPAPEPTKTEGTSLVPDASGLDSLEPPKPPGDTPRGSTNNPTSGRPRPNPKPRPPPSGGR
ncbi:hypothetical protein MVEN_00771500 [Mycena venus]|uniref:Uncharacterized protein n=1 Tax=Mycena venus TaxID=2733690 RepID=A0A8H7D3T3_9AGAR|nr:hypothetical protein MVEN_00771500 [Mycena venus]